MKRYSRTKRAGAILLTAALTAGLFVPASAASDLEGHWARPAMETWVEHGVVKGVGDGNYAPDVVLSRAQLFTLMNRIMGVTEKADITKFSDVAPDAWYAEDIAKAVASGIAQGDGTKMDPGGPVTREQTALVYSRVFHLDTKSAALDGFTDKDQVSSWAAEGVAAVVAAGIMHGVPGGAFAPGKEITRAEAVTMLDNSVDTYCGEAGTYTGDVEGNVLINAPSVVLKDAVVKGDIYIMPGAGSDVDLQGVKVTGKIVLLGGGVSLDKDSTAGGLVIWSADAKVDLAKGSQVTLLTVSGENATVTGGGSIKEAVIEASGANLAQKPDKVTVAPGLTAIVAGKVVPTKGGGGGGGGSQGSDPAPVIDRQRFTAGDPVDIFAPVPNGTDHTHGSGIAALPDGELLTVWFQGNGERDGTTTRIMASRLPVGATEWTEPFVIADAQNIADINPTIYVDSENKLWMFWYPVLSGMWETSQPRFAYAEQGSYEFASIGNTVPNWTQSDNIPIKIGPNTGGTVDPATDPFVLAVKAGYAKYNDYVFKDRYVPGEGEAVYDPETKASAYEDKNSGGGVNKVILEGEADWLENEILARIGGKTEQRFTPTVADKVGKDSDGNVPRSGYPLLRRMGWQTKNAPLEIQVKAGTVLSNGDVAKGGEKRLIVPLYSDGLEMSINVITDDWGKTWKMSGPVVGISGIQASMAQRADGDIVALMRNNGPAPYYVQYSISHDDGETWDTAKTRSDLFDSGVGHNMTTLSDTDWVFVSCSDQMGRGVLSVALSENEGKTWPWRRTIELDTRSSRGSYHYPAITADDEGNIFISYSIDYTNTDTAADGASLNGLNNIRYMKIDKDWIKAGDWTDTDRAQKAVFGYETVALSVTMPENFDKSNTVTVDGKTFYHMDEVKKVAPLLPTTIKGYLTYNNHGADGLALAAPEYVEIPVKVDLDSLQKALKLNDAGEKILYQVQTDELPEGITADMLPDFAPMLYQLYVVAE